MGDVCRHLHRGTGGVPGAWPNKNKQHPGRPCRFCIFRGHSSAAAAGRRREFLCFWWYSCASCGIPVLRVVFCAPCGIPWPAVVLWCAVVGCGIPWYPVACCGILWPAVVFCGILWYPAAPTPTHHTHHHTTHTPHPPTPHVVGVCVVGGVVVVGVWWV